MSSPVVTCPQCRAVNNLGSSRCFLCDRSLVGLRPDAKAEWESAPARGGTFHLATMMVVIALIAVYLGLFVSVPWLAVLLAIPGVIALIRTLLVSNRYDSRLPSTWGYVNTFMVTFGLVVAVMIASVVAFFATCFGVIALKPGPYGGDFALAGLVLGAVAAIAVPIAICVAIVRHRRKKSAIDSPTGSRD